MSVALKKEKEKAPTRIDINREWCKGCGICVAFCPHNVLELDDQEIAVVTNLDKCNGCRLCEYRCPDMAIELISE
jgi:2-oxoglutarate ferredoxin oxidoreductase subunit delta